MTTTLAACAQTPASPSSSGYAARPEAIAWAEDAAFRLVMPPEQILDMLARAQRSPDAQRLILPTSPGVRRSWSAYRDRFVEPVRLKAGAAFHTAHRDALERAEAAFGVPQDIIVAIIGIETLYGRHQGPYRALDVLATLAFDWPAEAPRDRSAFFLGQLEELIAFAHERAIDPETILASYAGAIGLPQFMPGTIRRFAIDWDGDGNIDLRTSPADAIGSVAQFLVAHGWEPQTPWWFEASVATDDPDALVANDLVPSRTLEEWRTVGVRCRAPDGYAGLLGLVDFETPDAPTLYRCGTPNFFAITQYNRSFFYAGAVIELAKALRARRGVHEGA